MELNARQVKAFWSKVKVGPADQCWPWKGARINSGYGVSRVVIEGKQSMRGAHRVAWHLSNGQEIGDLLVCHHCDVKICCNPAHLFLGTHKDNTRDMMTKGRGNLPALSDAQVARVKLMRAHGVPFPGLVKELGVSRQLLHRVVYDKPSRPSCER